MNTMHRARPGAKGLADAFVTRLHAEPHGAAGALAPAVFALQMSVGTRAAQYPSAAAAASAIGRFASANALPAPRVIKAADGVVAAVWSCPGEVRGWKTTAGLLRRLAKRHGLQHFGYVSAYAPIGLAMPTHAVDGRP